jgi:hypothetical protein
MEKKDLVGLFLIPDHLLRLAQSQAPAQPKPTVVEQVVQQVTDWMEQFPRTWTTAAKIKGSANAIHHVELRRIWDGKNTFLEFRCTCQSFRIQKKGYCKHTIQVKEDLEKKYTP